jgi:NTP pyrophosphatase (non-canonical NTP hydrolase)
MMIAREEATEKLDTVSSLAQAVYWSRKVTPNEERLAKAIMKLVEFVARPKEAKMISIYDLHKKMTAHLFPTFSSQDERFLALALCGEVGELANMIKKRWRDGADLSEEIKDEIADIRVYLELLAKVFGIEGNKLDVRVQMKLVKVVKKFEDRINAQ